MPTTKLYDLTGSGNVAREMRLHGDGDPLADPGFRRHVHAVTTSSDRAATAARLRPSLRDLPMRFRRFAGSTR